MFLGPAHSDRTPPLSGSQASPIAKQKAVCLVTLPSERLKDIFVIFEQLISCRGGGKLSNLFKFNLYFLKNPGADA